MARVTPILATQRGQRIHLENLEYSRGVPKFVTHQSRGGVRAVSQCGTLSDGMSGTVSQEALLPELAVGELGALRAVLSGRRTRGRLDARLDTDTQDTLLTWAARHGHAEAVRLLLEGGATAFSVYVALTNLPVGGFC